MSLTRNRDSSPPTWFNVLLGSVATLWLLLQIIAIIYDLETAIPYAYLKMFDTGKERLVSGVLVNIVVIGFLTLCLVLTYAYAIHIRSKLAVLACAAFAATLLILKILAIFVLFTSRLTVRYGPVEHGIHVLNIYHENMTAEHWKKELAAYAKAFPLHGSGITPPVFGDVMVNSSTRPPLENETTTVPGVKSDSSNITADTNSTATGERRRRAAATTNTTATATPSTNTAYIYIDKLDVNKSQALLEWHQRQEDVLLGVLGFVQQAAFCCGIDGYADYEQNRTELPTSCRCLISETNIMHVHCSERPYQLVHGENHTVWARGCRQVVTNFISYYKTMCYTVTASSVPLAIVVVLTTIVGCNLPDSKYDDYAESDDNENDSDDNENDSDDNDE